MDPVHGLRWTHRCDESTRRIAVVNSAQCQIQDRSTAQNLAEGMRRTGKDRAHLLTVALGSCDEARAIIEAPVVFGVVSPAERLKADALADRVCTMTYRPRQRSV